MPLSNQITAYEDCRNLFDAATEDSLGARLKFPTYTEALYFRNRMNQARSLEREESKRIYDKTSPAYGKTDYDAFVVRIREDTEGWFWVYVERRETLFDKIEKLSDLEDDDDDAGTNKELT